METARRRILAVAFLPVFIVNFVNEYAEPECQLKEISFPKLAKVYRDTFLIKRKDAEESKEFRELAKSLRRIE